MWADPVPGMTTRRRSQSGARSCGRRNDPGRTRTAGSSRTVSSLCSLGGVSRSVKVLALHPHPHPRGASTILSPLVRPAPLDADRRDRPGLAPFDDASAACDDSRSAHNVLRSQRCAPSVPAHGMRQNGHHASPSDRPAPGPRARRRSFLELERTRRRAGARALSPRADGPPGLVAPSDPETVGRRSQRHHPICTIPAQRRRWRPGLGGRTRWHWSPHRRADAAIQVAESSRRPGRALSACGRASGRTGRRWGPSRRSRGAGRGTRGAGGSGPGAWSPGSGRPGRSGRRTPRSG